MTSRLNTRPKIVHHELWTFLNNVTVVGVDFASRAVVTSSHHWYSNSSTSRSTAAPNILWTWTIVSLTASFTHWNSYTAKEVNKYLKTLSTRIIIVRLKAYLQAGARTLAHLLGEVLHLYFLPPHSTYPSEFTIPLIDCSDVVSDVKNKFQFSNSSKHAVIWSVILVYSWLTAGKLVLGRPIWWKCNIAKGSASRRHTYCFWYWGNHW